MATEPTPDPPRAAADLARRVYAASHLTGTFVLRSGATSSEYFDKYRFESDPRLLRELAQALLGCAELTEQTYPAPAAPIVEGVAG